MTALLRFDKVTCRRGGRLLFETLDLDLSPGETLHVAGPNGSGKSSLIRLAARLLRPESGTVEPAQVALADENLALDPELPLSPALEFWSGRGGDRTRLSAAMAALGLAELAAVPVRLLSAGQRKRAALARVAASGAALWLLDEPVNGLDSHGVADLAKLVAAHLGEGGAVLAASHVELPGTWRKLELGG